MHNQIIATIAAALAAWIFGAIWYGVLGKTWQAAQGLAQTGDGFGQRHGITSIPAN